MKWKRSRKQLNSLEHNNGDTEMIDLQTDESDPENANDDDNIENYDQEDSI